MGFRCFSDVRSRRSEPRAPLGSAQGLASEASPRHPSAPPSASGVSASVCLRLFPHLPHPTSSLSISPAALQGLSRSISPSVCLPPPRCVPARPPSLSPSLSPSKPLPPAQASWAPLLGAGQAWKPVPPPPLTLRPSPSSASPAPSPALPCPAEPDRASWATRGGRVVTSRGGARGTGDLALGPAGTQGGAGPAPGTLSPHPSVALCDLGQVPRHLWAWPPYPYPTPKSD